MKWPKSSAKQNSSEKTTFLKLFNINYLKYEIKVPRDCQELPESCLFIKKKTLGKHMYSSHIDDMVYSITILLLAFCI